MSRSQGLCNLSENQKFSHFIKKIITVLGFTLNRDSEIRVFFILNRGKFFNGDESSDLSADFDAQTNQLCVNQLGIFLGMQARKCI